MAALDGKSKLQLRIKDKLDQQYQRLDATGAGATTIAITSIFLLKISPK